MAETQLDVSRLGPLVQTFPCDKPSSALAMPLVYLFGCLVLTYQAWVFVIGVVYFGFVVWLVQRRAPKQIAVHEGGVVVTRHRDRLVVPWSEVRALEAELEKHGNHQLWDCISATRQRLLAAG